MSYATALAESCSHPHDIVVAPLDIERVKAHEHVHDKVGARSAIVDISHKMKMVDLQIDPMDNSAVWKATEEGIKKWVLEGRVMI